MAIHKNYINSSNQGLIGVLMAFLGIILFSAKAVIVKLCYQYDPALELDAITVLGIRMLYALPLYLIIWFFTRSKNRLDNKSIITVVILGLLGYYVASFFDFKGLKYITATLERLILFVYPTMVVILSRIFLKEVITTKQLISIFITYIGVVIVFFENIIAADFGDGILIGGSLIFLSALTYASYLVGGGWMIKKIGAVRFTNIAMVVACIAVLTHYSIYHHPTEIIQLPSQIHIYGMLMALFCTVIPSFLIMLSIQKIGASKVSIIGSFGPVSTIVLSILFLNETINAYQVIGGLIIIFGVLFVRNK